MRKYMAYAWITMFVLMFMSAFFTYPFLSQFIDQRNLENREKKEFSHPSLENYTEYHQLFEEWYENNLPYRDILIQSNRKLALYGFKESASESVVLGKDNWLFLSETIPDYKKINLYTLDQLEVICTNLKSNYDYFQRRNIDFIVFIAPNKASIYGEAFLPNYIYCEEGVSRTEQLVDYIRRNTDVPIVFPKDELSLIAKGYPEYPLYLHLDTHWNYLGGYCGVKSLLRELDHELPGVDEIVLEEFNSPVLIWNGYDLSNMLGMTGELTEDTNYKIDYGSNNVVEWNGDTSTDIVDFYTFCQTASNAADHRKIMFIRDSFGSAMLPFIASEFREVYSPHVSFQTDSSTIDTVQPDVVIYEYVERGDLNNMMLFE